MTAGYSGGREKKNKGPGHQKGGIVLHHKTVVLIKPVELILYSS